jgi:hypothetical protein
MTGRGQQHIRASLTIDPASIATDPRGNANHHSGDANAWRQGKLPFTVGPTVAAQTPAALTMIRNVHVVARRATYVLLAMTLGCEKPTAPMGGGPIALEAAFSFPSLAASDFITHFEFDSKGTLWVGTFNGAILRMRDGQVTQFDAGSILGAAHVWDLFIDSADRPWIAGATGSLAVFDHEAWSQQAPADLMGLSAKIRQVAVNAAGDVLLGVGDVAAGGLLLRHDGTWKSITPANSSLPSPLQLDIDVAKDGTFWVASDQWQGKGGLIRIAGGQITGIFNTAQPGLLYESIDDMAITPDRIWLGFAARLYDVPGAPDGGIQALSLSGGRPTSWFPFESGLGSNRVRSLIWSSAGELWFTLDLDEDSVCNTCYVGVGRLDAAGKFQVLSHFNSDIEPNEYLPEIREGPGGVIYVARANRREIARVVPVRGE